MSLSMDAKKIVFGLLVLVSVVCPQVTVASNESVSFIDVFARDEKNLLSIKSFKSKGGVEGWGNWLELRAGVVSNPAVITRAQHRVEVFARDLKDTLMFRSFESEEGWGDWRGMKGGIVSNPVVISRTAKRLDVFARDRNNNLWLKMYHAKTWEKWEDLNFRTPFDPVVVSRRPDCIEVFVRNEDNSLYMRRYKREREGWNKWQKLSEEMKIASNPIVVSRAPIKLDIFARDTANKLWLLKYHEMEWADWEDLNFETPFDPVVVARSKSRLEVFARDRDGSLFMRRYKSGKPWSAWKKIGEGIVSNPVILSRAENALDIFARSSENRLLHLKFHGGVWSNWEDLSFETPFDPVVVSVSENRLDIFARAEGNTLHARSYVSGDGWRDWKTLGDRVFGQPVVVPRFRPAARKGFSYVRKQISEGPRLSEAQTGHRPQNVPLFHEGKATGLHGEGIGDASPGIDLSKCKFPDQLKPVGLPTMESSGIWNLNIPVIVSGFNVEAVRPQPQRFGSAQPAEAASFPAMPGNLNAPGVNMPQFNAGFNPCSTIEVYRPDPPFVPTVHYTQISAPAWTFSSPFLDVSNSGGMQEQMQWGYFAAVYVYYAKLVHEMKVAFDALYVKIQAVIDIQNKQFKTAQREILKFENRGSAVTSSRLKEEIRTIQHRREEIRGVQERFDRKANHLRETIESDKEKFVKSNGIFDRPIVADLDRQLGVLKELKAKVHRKADKVLDWLKKHRTGREELREEVKTFEEIVSMKAWASEKMKITNDALEEAGELLDHPKVTASLEIEASAHLRREMAYSNALMGLAYNMAADQRPEVDVIRALARGAVSMATSIREFLRGVRNGVNREVLTLAVVAQTLIYNPEVLKQLPKAIFELISKPQGFVAYAYNAYVHYSTVALLGSAEQRGFAAGELVANTLMTMAGGKIFSLGMPVLGSWGKTVVAGTMGKKVVRSIEKSKDLAKKVAKAKGESQRIAEKAARRAEGIGKEERVRKATGQSGKIGDSAGEQVVEGGGAKVPVGRRGEPIEVQPGTNQPTTIDGRKFSGHALDRMQGRGVPPSAVEEAIRNRVTKVGKEPSTFEHTMPGVKVITNTKGDVVTVIPR